MTAGMRTFVRAWMSSPARIGAIAPSGRMLAELITAGIRSGDGPVLELGPGSGVFTRVLLERGLDESELTLIEYSAGFIDFLNERFPRARVLRMDAARLSRANLYEGAPVGAVVSGLPILSMKPRRAMAILAGAFGYLRPGGSLYQFTYGPRCPVPRRLLDRLGLKATHIGYAPLNAPPASVYRLSRRPNTVGGFRKPHLPNPDCGPGFQSPP